MMHHLDGTVTPLPPARSMAAIKRLYGRAPPPERLGRDGLAMKALHYAMWLQGEQAAYRQGLYTAYKLCHFRRGADGSQRVRAVTLNDRSVLIPHWDFIPDEPR